MRAASRGSHRLASRAPQPTEPAPERPDDEYDAPDDRGAEDDREPDVVGDEPQLQGERAGDGEEQVQVDERPGRDEEQLVDDLAAQETRERSRPG